MNLRRLESAEEVGAFLQLLPLEWREELEAWMRSVFSLVPENAADLL